MWRGDSGGSGRERAGLMGAGWRPADGWQAAPALVRPKRMSSKTENAIPFPRRESLQRLHQLRNLHLRSDQHVDMICHDDPCVEEVMRIPLPKVQSFHHHVRDVRPAQVEWPGTAAIQKTIHCKKRLSGGNRWGKGSICRKTPMEPPSQKDGMTQCVVMRQTPRMESGHKRSVSVRRQNSHGMWGRLVTGGRLS